MAAVRALIVLGCLGSFTRRGAVGVVPFFCSAGGRGRASAGLPAADALTAADAAGRGGGAPRPVFTAGSGSGPAGGGRTAAPSGTAWSGACVISSAPDDSSRRRPHTERSLGRKAVARMAATEARTPRRG